MLKLFEARVDFNYCYMKIIGVIASTRVVSVVVEVVILVVSNIVN